MKDIKKPIFSIENRKQCEYDDDFTVLFYKGEIVARELWETFDKNWVEEEANENFEQLQWLIQDITSSFVLLDEEDNKKTWKEIWDSLEWNEKTNSYQYGNWELIVLDV